eukprot:sb/3461222/
MCSRTVTFCKIQVLVTIQTSAIRFRLALDQFSITFYEKVLKIAIFRQAVLSPLYAILGVTSTECAPSHKDPSRHYYCFTTPHPLPQVTCPYIGLGDVLTVTLASTPTAEDALQGQMELVSSFTYSSCNTGSCQVYGVLTARSTGLKIISTRIGAEFLHPTVGLHQPFTLVLQPVEEGSVCSIKSTITMPSGVVTSGVTLLPSGSASLETSTSTVAIATAESFDNQTSLRVSFIGVGVEGQLKFNVRNRFSYCGADGQVIEETSTPSVEITSPNVNISIATHGGPLQVGTELRYTLDLTFLKPIPVYNVTVAIGNTWLEFTGVQSDVTAVHRTVTADGVLVSLPYLEGDVQITVYGVTSDITLATITTSSVKLSYRSHPGLGVVYTSSLVSLPAITIAHPTIRTSLNNGVPGATTIGEGGGGARVAVPEGEMSSLIITVNTGIGISIEECTVHHSALTTSSEPVVSVDLTAAQVDMVSVYNQPDNLMTNDDIVVVRVVLKQTLVFGNLDTVYATLDGGSTKSYPVPWGEECNLQVNMVRTDQLSSVEGGDMISYDVIVTHGIMSRVDATNLVILIPLSDCSLAGYSGTSEVRTAMGNRVILTTTVTPDLATITLSTLLLGSLAGYSGTSEVRTAMGNRVILTTTVTPDLATITLSTLLLDDSLTVPVSFRVSDTIHPGSHLNFQTSVLYRSSPDTIQRRSTSCHTSTILTALPKAAATLQTNHQTNRVSIGESVSILCLVELPRGLIDLSVQVTGQDSVAMGAITSNLTTDMVYDNMLVSEGLNKATVMFTGLENTAGHALMFSVSPTVDNTARNVAGEKVEVKLVVGYSFTSQGMIEDTIFFTLQIVEPVLVTMVTMVTSDSGVTGISLTYSHSASPQLEESTANAYNVSSTFYPAFQCDGDTHLDTLPLGETSTVELQCQPSPDVVLGGYYAVTMVTIYSSVPEGDGRIRTLETDTGFWFQNTAPSFSLKVQSEVKVGETVPVELEIGLGVGTMPETHIQWRASEGLVLAVQDCTMVEAGESIMSRIYTNVLGVVSIVGSVSVSSATTILCKATLTVTLEMPNSGQITLAVQYGVNSTVLTEEVTVTKPFLSVICEMPEAGAVDGGDILSAKYTVSHDLDLSTGDAYSVWINTTLIGASINDQSTFNNNLGVVAVGGFGYICVEISVPVCRTSVLITTRHPMMGDRELGEVEDPAEVRYKDRELGEDPAEQRSQGQ